MKELQPLLEASGLVEVVMLMVRVRMLSSQMTLMWFTVQVVALS